MRRPLAFLFALVLFVAAVPAWSARLEVKGSSVVMNGVTVATFLTRTVDGVSPVARANQLSQSLSSLPYYGDVKNRKVGRTQVIFAGGTRIITITAAEAKRHGSTVDGLAVSWVTQLNQAFRTPALKVDSANVAMPVGESRTVNLSGYEAKRAYVSATDPAIKIERLPTALRISADSPVTGAVNLVWGEDTQTITVSALPYAAQLPQTVSATVTGSPAAASIVTGAAQGAIRSQLQVPESAHVTVASIPDITIPDGATRTVAVPVKIEAPNCYPRTGNVNVVVRNASLAYRREDALWYSNNPETVRQVGPLFSATLTPGNGARLLYHHVNDSPAPIYLRVQVVNSSDTPARVAVIPGDAEPDPNPVRAGLRAAEMYFRAWRTGSSEVVTIPPRSTLPISFRRLARQDTSSGLCGLRLLDGPPELLVRTDALPLLPLEARWQSALASTTPWHEVGCNPLNSADMTPFDLSEHIYPNPFKTGEMKYEVGKRYGFFKIGERPIAGATEGRVLDGNFGVIYNIKAEAYNPSGSPVDVEVVFEASAGYSGGLFFVNGAFRASPLIQPKAEYRIERFRLGPGESKSLEIVTIPLSGSSYPSLISLRPVQELSAGVPR